MQTTRLICCTKRTITSMAGTGSSDYKELKANWKTQVEVPVLTLSDVARHKSKSDLWIVIHGKGFRCVSANLKIAC